jgi:3-dehydroquinate synthase
MTERRLLIKSGQADYEVEFRDDVSELTNFLKATPKAVLLVDKKVAQLYSAPLSALTGSLPTLVVPATEEEKTLDGVTRALTFLQQHDCNKQSVVIAIGGGILQDIVAFAAHVYYRGLKWHFVPTTLLSMADSCIGAKSSINFNGFKNQLGSFHSPARVYICDQFVRTLSDDDVRSGYGEIFKLFLIGSRDLFGRLKKAVAQDGFRNPSLPDFIYESLRVKQVIIEVDEYETGPRRILNYGHTFGHALEGLTHYEVPHGLAVVWGLDLVNWLAYRAGLLSREDFDDIHEFAARYFSRDLSRPVTATELIQATRRDKKVADGKINLALLERPGTLKIVPTTYDAALETAVSEYLNGYSILPSK